jgi:hypothetical protein
VERRHSATRIHPELQDLEVGDLVPYGAGAIARVEEIEPFGHLVAGETFLLRPLPGDRTRLIVRYQGKGFISAAAGAVAPDAALRARLIHFAVTRVPGGELIARAIDFFIGDPLPPRTRSRCSSSCPGAGSSTPTSRRWPPTALPLPCWSSIER